MLHVIYSVLLDAQVHVKKHALMDVVKLVLVHVLIHVKVHVEETA